VWARLADALAIAALLLVVSILVFGGFTLAVGPLRISSHSPWRLLLLAAVVAAVRHWAAPAPPLHQRVRRWRGIAADERHVVTIALTSRIAVLLTAYFAVLTIGLAPTGFKLSPDPLLDLPGRFDAGWYGAIAMDGYRFEGRFDRQQNIAFFPAFPMSMRAAGVWTGAWVRGIPKGERTARALWGGVIISIVAFVWGAVYVGRLASETIGSERATEAVALLAAYPFSVAFSAPYMEGLFLLGCVAAFYHFRRRDWVRAALWGGLVGLTRPNGCLLSVVLACLIVEHVWRERRAWREYPLITALLAASASGLTMLAHTIYVRQLTGVWFGWARVQGAWGRSFQGLDSVVEAFNRIDYEGFFQAIANTPFDALNAVGLIVALVMLPAVFRHVGLAAGVFVLLNVLPPLLTGGVLSMGRFTSTLFPLFLALAAILPPRATVPVTTAFAVGQGLVAAVFFTWRGLF
jgi:hypothetical protein